VSLEVEAPHQPGRAPCRGSGKSWKRRRSSRGGSIDARGAHRSGIYAA